MSKHSLPMRHKLVLLPLLALLLAVGLVATAAPTAAQGGGATVVQVQNWAKVNGAKRLGINIGARSSFGAAQFLKNIVPNPGFESSEFGMIFQVLPGASATRVQSDNWQTQWNNDFIRVGQPTGFWNGAAFEIVNGASRGRFGTITNFTLENGRYTFYFNAGGAVPAAGDAIILRKEIGGYNFDTEPYAKAAPGIARPASPGQQSLRLSPSTNNWQPSYQIGFDTFGRDIDPTAGKLLHVQGPWQIDLWAQGVGANDTLQVTFRRTGEATFFNETIKLNQGWQHITRNFWVAPETDADKNWPGYKPGALLFEMRVVGQGAYVDDLAVFRTDYNNPTVFTDPFLNSLKQLRPGVIRNWGDQGGSTLDNQLASPFARQTTGFSPRDRVAPNYHYSLHEFLQLAQQVGAEPWYVVPANWTTTDLQNLMAYLGAPAGSHPYADRRAALGQAAPWTNVFSQIHLEYGNEIWGSNFGGDPFVGASLRGGINAGQVASARIGVMKGSPWYNAGKFNMIIGGQARFPGRQSELEANSVNHDTIGFAPYYAQLDTWSNNAQMYYPLFAHAQETVSAPQSQMVQSRNILANAGRGTEMAIYEINVHAITGWSPAATRNDFLTSLGSGLSLPLTMLTYQRDMGIRTQTAFQAAQYSTRIFNGQNAQVWGMLRDVEATTRKRPTWLGMELANKAIRGNMLNVVQSGANPTFTQTPLNGLLTSQTVPYIQSFAFQAGNSYAVMLFNLNLDQTLPVQLQLPTGVSPNATIHALTGDNIGADNETWNAVNIRTWAIGDFGQNYWVSLPPHSAYVIEWQGQ